MKLILEPGVAAKYYWRDLWHYRELLYFLAWRDIVVRYKQTAIGVAWVLIRPALTMLVFVVFRRVFGLKPGGLSEPILVFAAVLPWQFFSTAALGILRQSDRECQPDFESLFPSPHYSGCCRGDGLRGLSDHPVPARCAHALVWRRPWLATSGGAAIRAVGVALSLGLGLLLSALNVEYRDFRYVVPFIVQFGLFISPVAYTTADVPERWRLLYSLNPMVGIIDGFRWSILRGQPPLDLQAAGLWSGIWVDLLLGAWYFRRMERSFADII